MQWRWWPTILLPPANRPPRPPGPILSPTDRSGNSYRGGSCLTPILSAQTFLAHLAQIALGVLGLQPCVLLQTPQRLTRRQRFRRGGLGGLRWAQFHHRVAFAD